jgi:hypothetical protein
MLRLNKPAEVNGIQLVNELRAEGIEIADALKGSIGIEGNKLLVYVNEQHLEKVTEIVNAHIAQPTPEPTIEDKLSSVGLSLPNLKAALGL